MDPRFYENEYFFIGKLGKDIAADDIEAALPQLIAEQQARNGAQLGGTKETVRVVDYAYTAAEPNCWMVYARWKILPV
jgi:hypothetical protein